MKSPALSLKPSKPTATVHEVAAALGVTHSGVIKAAEAGHFAKPVKGRLDVLDVLKGWAARERARIAEKTNADARIKSARAEKLELGNDALKRELIPAEEVRRDVTRSFTELKTQLLVIPRRLGQPLAMVTDAVEVEERIQKELVSVLDTMSRGEWIEKPNTNET